MAEGITSIRAMTHADIPLGMELKTLAGWNQLKEDWRMFLSGGGENFVASLNGRDIGTAMTIPFEDRFTWIAMVLVHPSARRKGIGKALLNKCIEQCSPGITPRLDATPAGFELYKILGFKAEYELIRMIKSRKASRTIKPMDCQPVKEPELPAIIQYDRTVFGAGRDFILRSLQKRNPDYAWRIGAKDSTTAYCFGRSGSNFEQIGPLIANDLQEAKALYSCAIQAATGKDLVIDVLADKGDWISFLEQEGFEHQRPFIRMCLGDLRYPGNTRKQYAIAGPEIG